MTDFLLEEILYANGIHLVRVDHLLGYLVLKQNGRNRNSLPTHSELAFQDMSVTRHTCRNECHGMSVSRTQALTGYRES